MFVVTTSLCPWTSKLGAKNHTRYFTVVFQLITRLGSFFYFVESKELGTTWLEMALQTQSLESLGVAFSEVRTKTTFLRPANRPLIIPIILHLTASHVT